MELRDRDTGLMSWVTPTLVAATIIFFVRMPILFDPPYYDFAFSFWAEADFLAKSDFDFHRLRYEEPFLLSEQGGRRAYMTSVLPAVAAAMMKLAPSPASSFALYRVLMFLAAGVMGTLLYRLFVHRFGMVQATLIVAFVLTIPSLSTQLDMLAMEIPVAMLAVATAYFISQSHWPAAAVSSFGAYLMKASGMIVTLSLTATLLLIVATSILARRRGPFFGLACSIVALAVEWAITQWGDTFTGQIMSGAPLAMVLVWAPDLAIGTVVAMIALFLMCRRSIRDIDNRTDGKPFRESMSALTDFIVRERLVLYSAIAVIGVMAALHRGPHLPRYYAMAVPLVVVLLVELIFSPSARNTRWSWILMSGIVLNLVNWSGALYPSIDWGMEIIAKIPARSVARSGSFFERSREYVSDLRSTQLLINELISRHPEEVVICGMPFTYFLAYPSFGYVEKPIIGYSISRTGDSIPEFHRADQLLQDQPVRAIYIRVASYFYLASNLIEIDEPSPQDEILYSDGDRFRNAMTMYRKRWPTDPPTKEDRNRYFQRMAWPRSRLAAQLTVVRWREGLIGCEKMLRDRAQERTLPSELRSEITIVADAIAERRRVESLGRADSSHPPTPSGIDDLFERALEEFHRTDWDAGVSSCREFLGRL